MKFLNLSTDYKSKLIWLIQKLKIHQLLYLKAFLNLSTDYKSKLIWLIQKLKIHQLLYLKAIHMIFGVRYLKNQNYFQNIIFRSKVITTQNIYGVWPFTVKMYGKNTRRVYSLNCVKDFNGFALPSCEYCGYLGGYLKIQFTMSIMRQSISSTVILSQATPGVSRLVSARDFYHLTCPEDSWGSGIISTILRGSTGDFEVSRHVSKQIAVAQKLYVHLAIWLLLFKQRRMQFKPIKRRLFCWTGGQEQ